MLLYKPIIQSANIKIPCISTGRTTQRPICAKGKRRSTYSYGKSRDQEIPECICVTTLVRCVCVGFFPMTQVPWVFETRNRRKLPSQLVAPSLACSLGILLHSSLSLAICNSPLTSASPVGSIFEIYAASHQFPPLHSHNPISAPFIFLLD